jgi:hypothetical protein
MQSGRIVEIGTTKKDKYEAYQCEYMPFVTHFKASNPRMVDKALFAFGQFLKLAAKYAQPVIEGTS